MSALRSGSGWLSGLAWLSVSVSESESESVGVLASLSVAGLASVEESGSPAVLP
jgi:hypothetical protein